MVKKQAKAKKAKRPIARKAKRPIARKSAAGHGYNPHTGKPTGRAIGAQERLEKLAAKYEAEGLSAPEARARAREEMRDNPRKDWRVG